MQFWQFFFFFFFLAWPRLYFGSVPSIAEHLSLPESLPQAIIPANQNDSSFWIPWLKKKQTKTNQVHKSPYSNNQQSTTTTTTKRVQGRKRIFVVALFLETLILFKFFFFLGAARGKEQSSHIPNHFNNGSHYCFCLSKQQQLFLTSVYKYQHWHIYSVFRTSMPPLPHNGSLFYSFKPNGPFPLSCILRWYQR